MPDAIPLTLGNPPTVVAPWAVWVTLAVPLFAGILMVWALPQTRIFGGVWPARINRIVRLDWFFRLAWWSADRVSEVWGNSLRVVEGAGHIGWLIVFVLIGYLMMR